MSRMNDNEFFMCVIFYLINISPKSLLGSVKPDVSPCMSCSSLQSSCCRFESFYLHQLLLIVFFHFKLLNISRVRVLWAKKIGKKLQMRSLAEGNKRMTFSYTVL